MLHYDDSDPDPVEAAHIAAWDARCGLALDHQAFETLAQASRAHNWHAYTLSQRSCVQYLLQQSIRLLDDAAAYALQEGLGGMEHETADHAAERSGAAATRVAEIDRARDLVWSAYRVSKPVLRLVSGGKVAA